MAKYQVVAIRRPDGWTPARPDDVPETLGKPLDTLGQYDDLFDAVAGAIRFNQAGEAAESRRWAVVVEPGCRGQRWRAARLCTPIDYKVTAIWWPDGWEPDSPLDVPNCLWRAQGSQDRPPLSYRRALATMRALNRQCMDQAGTSWYVVVAVENEPVSQTIAVDATGSETRVEVRRVHTIRPPQGGHGRCAHCPAHDFPCAKTNWDTWADNLTTTQSRGPRSG